MGIAVTVRHIAVRSTDRTDSLAVRFAQDSGRNGQEQGLPQSIRNINHVN